MPARRIVAALSEDEKSAIAFEESIPAECEPARIRLTNLWLAPFEAADNEAPFQGGFVPFAMSQTRDDIYAMTLVEYAPGFGLADPGMHSTETLDHFYVVEGEIVMVLEADEVVFRVGDTGIIRGAVHGWRNNGLVAAKLIFFVIPAVPRVLSAQMHRALSGGE